jgi:dienelactone hydrolase
MVKSSIHLPQDDGLILHVNLYHAQGAKGRPAVIVSHDSNQDSQSKELAPLLERLVTAGYVVCVPDHASPIKGSARDANNPVGYYGISSLYGVGDTVSLPPMAMRVWDDLRALAYLLERPEVNQRKIAMVGLGVGSVDAAMTTALEDGIAALGVVGAITVEDWTERVAPSLSEFDRIMPYLPGIIAVTDLQYIYSAAAPRPLLLLDETDRQNWPEGAYQRVQKMVQDVYGINGDVKSITTGVRQSLLGATEIEAWLRSVIGGN